MLDFDLSRVVLKLNLSDRCTFVSMGMMSFSMNDRWGNDGLAIIDPSWIEPTGKSQPGTRKYVLTLFDIA